MKKYWALKTKKDIKNHRVFEDQWDKFKDNKVIAIGWHSIDVTPGKVNLSDLASAIQRAYGNSDRSAIIQAGIIEKFVHISEGDEVLLCGGYSALYPEKVHLYGRATVTGSFEDHTFKDWNWRFSHKAQIIPFGKAGQDKPKEFLVHRLKKGSLLQTVQEISKDGFEKVVKDL